MADSKRTITDAEARVIGWDYATVALRYGLERSFNGYPVDGRTAEDEEAVKKQAYKILASIERQARKRRSILEHRKRLTGG